jgi:hypothetical protein
LQERRLGLQHEAVPIVEWDRFRWRPIIGVVVAIGVLSAGMILWRQARQGTAPGAQSAGSIVQRLHSGNLDILLLSSTGALHQGRNTFSFEFRAGDGRLVDVGTVRASGNMPMPGMVMSSGLQVQRTAIPGRYDATAEFGMAGAWHMGIEWDGPAGHGSINFEGAVQ